MRIGVGVGVRVGVGVFVGVRVEVGIGVGKGDGVEVGENAFLEAVFSPRIFLCDKFWIEPINPVLSFKTKIASKLHVSKRLITIMTFFCFCTLPMLAHFRILFY